MEFGEIGKLAEDIRIDNIFDSVIKDTRISENMTAEMKSQFEALKMEPSKFEIRGEIGKYELLYDGEVVDVEGASKAMKEGRLLDALKEYKAPKEVLMDKTVIDYSTKYEKAWKQQESIKAKAKWTDITENGKKGTKSVGGEPKTPEEFNKIIEENKSLKEAVKKMKNEATEASKTGKVEVTKGEWTKTKIALKVLLAAIATGTLYELIKSHQNAMNGCWLVNISDGSKCKVLRLTCNKDEKTSSDPCQSNYKCKNICTKKDGTCFGEDACIKCSDVDATGVQTCAETLKECDEGSSCDKCSCDSIGCPDGYFLQCVDIDFLGATEDFIQQPIKWTSNIVTKIIYALKIILYIALGMIGVFILFKFVMWLIHEYNKNKKENNSSKVESQMKVKNKK